MKRETAFSICCYSGRRKVRSSSVSQHKDMQMGWFSYVVMILSVLWVCSICVVHLPLSLSLAPHLAQALAQQRTHHKNTS